MLDSSKVIGGPLSTGRHLGGRAIGMTREQRDLMRLVSYVRNLPVTKRRALSYRAKKIMRIFERGQCQTR